MSHFKAVSIWKQNPSILKLILIQQPCESWEIAMRTSSPSLKCVWMMIWGGILNTSICGACFFPLLSLRLQHCLSSTKRSFEWPSRADGGLENFSSILLKSRLPICLSGKHVFPFPAWHTKHATTLAVFSVFIYVCMYPAAASTSIGVSKHSLQEIKQ